MAASIDDQIESLWDFNDPEASESRFAEAVAAAREANDEPRRLALMTQQARSLGLQKRFTDAHAVLDEVEQSLSQHADARLTPVRVRLLLERGRTFNSSGSKEMARPMFERAWDEANVIHHDPLAVDAAHMVAIACDSREEALEWNRRAIELADSSSDPRARRWRGSLHNNLGWTHHERGDYETAMHHFEQALAARVEQSQLRDILIARWCIARCLRSMKRIDEALGEQVQLLEDWAAIGEQDGFVFEELAECLRAVGRTSEARAHFAKTHELLSDDPWIDPQRLKRLAEQSQECERGPGVDLD